MSIARSNPQYGMTSASGEGGAQHLQQQLQSRGGFGGRWGRQGGGGGFGQGLGGRQGFGGEQGLGGRQGFGGEQGQYGMGQEQYGGGFGGMGQGMGTQKVPIQTGQEFGQGGGYDTEKMLGQEGKEEYGTTGGQGRLSGQGQLGTQFGQMQLGQRGGQEEDWYTQRGQGYEPGEMMGRYAEGQTGQTGQQQQGYGGRIISQGGEWKQERAEEPIVYGAPSGPMPGKSRAAPMNRSAEERNRARKFGFPPTRLLILTDGSENSYKALEAALHFRRRNDSIFILNVVQLMDETPDFDNTNKLLKEKGKSVIDDFTKIINEREIGRWECACLPSKNAKQAALDYAMKNSIDLIFVGCRGIDSNTGDFYPGSFSKWVINNSHCSVMLVR